MIAYVALGSNLGDRRATLDAAISARGCIRQSVIFTSPAITRPSRSWSGGHQYLYAVADFVTLLGPEELLKRLSRSKRIRPSSWRRTAPRTLYLDLLLYGDLVRYGLLIHSFPIRRAAFVVFVMDPSRNCAESASPCFWRDRQRLAEEYWRSPPPGLPLAGLRTLVTGSSSGIGRAIAEAFAEAGAWVIVRRQSKP